MDISNIFNTGYSGLVTAKAGIATAGHNITNANNEAYSRQRVISEPNLDAIHSVGHGVMGGGVKVAAIERINDGYLGKQILHTKNELDFFSEKQIYLKQIEDIFNEIGNRGLNNALSTFFNDIRKLSQEPENLSLRNSLQETSKTLAREFNRNQKELENLNNTINLKISLGLKELNSILTEIGDLNLKIQAVQNQDAAPNDLLDLREKLLKDLYGLLDVTAYQDEFGNYHIGLQQGGVLVAGTEIARLSQVAAPDGLTQIMSSGCVDPTVTKCIQRRKLGALLELKNDTVHSLMNRLDRMAYQLVDSVNELHLSGVTGDGRTQVPFFKPLKEPARAAEWISLSEQVTADPQAIAAGFEWDAPGDNRLLLALASLQNEKVVFDEHLSEPVTFHEWYNGFVSELGLLFNKNEFSYLQQKDLMTQFSQLRNQLSGVSLDEETTLLLQYQQMYDAAAKIIQTSNQMMETILSLKKD